MEFQVLGPLEVRDGERVLRVGRGKPSALLALLLLNADEVVSTDRLIDELWGEQPPATAGKALQVYVAKLRQVLGADLIATRPPGYELRLADAGRLDARRFERGLTAAREALAAGDARGASALLSDALALWRGPPLADVAYERFAQPEILRLEELRLAALEERIEADLALGRHSELVGELERLVAQHPLRERPRAQLMLALYRSGRQAEALEAYQAARHALVDGLGIEPGAALQDLQQALLAQDPALGAAAPPPPSTQPERKLVSVLALDVEPAEALVRDPERLREALDALADAVGAEVAAADGRLEPETPGALLASFGADRALEQHARRALDVARAALALDRDELTLRAGVESGEVIVGEHLEGAVPGAARRLAARAEPGEVVLGDRAQAAVGATRSGAAAFVGRAAELELVGRRLERLAEQERPHLVALVGEAGVGKSRFVRELHQRLDPEPAWLLGRCPAYGRATTYRPIAEILRADPAVAVRERRGEEGFLRIALGLESPAAAHPWEARERLGEEWVDLLSEIAASGPAVVVVEDLHWAEDALLELIDLARRATGPLLLLVTARPELLERSASFGAGHNASRLWLDPLAGGEAAELLDALAPGLSQASRELVLERAEGNPFFLEEALAWVLEHAGSGGPPDSVQAVIAARIDLLPAGDKQTLQAAAVAGRIFWGGALAELTGAAVGLGLLEERDFVRRRATSSLAGEREYAFKHALSREVAYASLPLGRRARLHAAFADWLEQAGGSSDEHAALLAHHLGASAAPAVRDLAWGADTAGADAVRARAVHWLARAGELAIRRYELDPGVAMLEEALALERDGPERGALWRSLAWGRRMQFDTDGYREAAETALALDPPPAAAAEVLAELAYAGSQPWLWREPPDPDDVEDWIERVLAAAAPGSRIRGLALTARTMVDRGADSTVIDEAVAIAEADGDPLLLARSHLAKIDAARANRRYGDAVRWVERTLALESPVTDPFHRDGLLFGSTFTYLSAGRVAEARRVVPEHLALCARLPPHQRVHATTGSVMPELAAGDWASLASQATAAVNAAEENRATPCQFNWRSVLMTAVGHARLGQLAEAERLEQCAADLHQVGGAFEKEPALLRLALARGDHATAERLLGEAPEPDPWWDFDAEAARLDALAALGDREGVEREAEVALALGGYAEPFALRALGLVREDEELLAQATRQFTANGAGGHAQWPPAPS